MLIRSLFFSLLIFLNCNSDSTQIVEYDIENYTDSDNPMDNIDVCFTQARKILGNDTCLVYLEGVQKDNSSNSIYNLDWYWYFYNTNKNKSLTFDISTRKIREYSDEESPIGIEYIFPNEPRIGEINYTPKDIFNKCITDNGITIYSMRIFIPLVFPPSDFCYYFFKNNGLNTYNVDYFVYSSKSGSKM